MVNNNIKLYDELITSYEFSERCPPEKVNGINKYYIIIDHELVVSYALCFYNDGMFSLYRRDGGILFRINRDLLNMYNLALVVENAMK